MGRKPGPQGTLASAGVTGSVLEQSRDLCGQVGSSPAPVFVGSAYGLKAMLSHAVVTHADTHITQFSNAVVTHLSHVIVTWPSRLSHRPSHAVERSAGVPWCHVSGHTELTGTPCCLSSPQHPTGPTVNTGQLPTVSPPRALGPVAFPHTPPPPWPGRLLPLFTVLNL